jgi:hypothetical protein
MLKKKSYGLSECLHWTVTNVKTLSERQHTKTATYHFMEGWCVDDHEYVSNFFKLNNSSDDEKEAFKTKIKISNVSTPKEPYVIKIYKSILKHERIR